MPRYYTRVSKLKGLSRIARDQGLELDPILQQVGIDPGLLNRPEEVIDYGAFCELLRRCAISWKLPDIGLRMIRHQEMDVLGPVALLARMERSAARRSPGNRRESRRSCQRDDHRPR